MTRDPYKLLGVAKSASASEIKSAFRKLAKKCHPDQNPDNPKAQERFTQISQAYDIIGDEKRRAEFDRGEIDNEGKPLHAHAGAGSPFSGFGQGAGGQHSRSQFDQRFARQGQNPHDVFSDIFSQAFGGQGADPRRPRSVPKGADVSVNAYVTLEDVALSAKITATLPHGRNLAVKLPQYVEDGQIIRLKGQGETALPGGQPGDVLLKVHFSKHSQFKVDGRNLHCDLAVPLHEGVLGAKVPLQTLDGKIAVNIAPWTSSDKVLRIKGRGLPKKSGGRADLYVHICLMLPKENKEQLIELCSQMSE